MLDCRLLLCMDMGLNKSLALMVVCTVSLLFFPFVLSFVSFSWRNTALAFWKIRKR